MANDVGEAKVSSGGIHPVSSDVKPLEKSVKLGTQSSSPAFGAAFTSLAMTPTLMGEIGSSMATNASIKIAELTGQSLGKNPQGDILPPITNFDKYVTQAYSTQAQVTLGLQANEMMAKAQTDMNKAYKMTPEMIRSYSQNMAEGLSDILKNAPSTVRPQLESQFGSHLISSTAGYNNKLQSQNKEDAKDSNDTWRQQAQEQMMNLVKDGTPESLEAAEILKQQIQENIKSNESLGMISKKQAYTAQTETKLNYESSLSIDKYRQAVNKGMGDQYLSSIAFDKMPGLSWSESEAVRNNTMKWAQAALAADSRYQTLLGAQARNDIVNGSFAPKMNYFEEEMTPTNFLNTMTAWTAQQHTQSKDNVEVSNIIKAPGNVDSYKGAKASSVNKSFRTIADSIYQSNQDAVKSGKNVVEISMDDAEVMAHKEMAVLSQEFYDNVNKLASSPDPQNLERSFQMYSRIKDLGSKTAGISTKSIAAMSLYKNLMSAPSMDPQKAAELAYNQVYQPNEEHNKVVKRQIDEYKNVNLKTANQVASWAMKMGGFYDIPVQNITAYSDQVEKMFTQFANAVGDVTVAEQMTSDAIRRTYAPSSINGYPEVSFLPPELEMQLPGSAPIIQQNLIDQMVPQFEESKKLFDTNPGQPSYWQLKPGRISFDEYLQAKNIIRQEMDKPSIKQNIPDSIASLASEFDIVKQFEKGGPVIVQEIHRGGEIQEYALRFVTSDIAQRSPGNANAQQVLNAQLVDPNTFASSRAMFGYFGSMATSPLLRPNKQYVAERYMSLFEPGKSYVSPEQIIEDHKALAVAKREEDKKNRDVLSGLSTFAQTVIQ